jgi:hypothetical protein
MGRSPLGKKIKSAIAWYWIFIKFDSDRFVNEIGRSPLDSKLKARSHGIEVSPNLIAIALSMEWGDRLGQPHTFLNKQVDKNDKTG